MFNLKMRSGVKKGIKEQKSNIKVVKMTILIESAFIDVAMQSRVN